MKYTFHCHRKRGATAVHYVSTSCTEKTVVAALRFIKTILAAYGESTWDVTIHSRNKTIGREVSIRKRESDALKQVWAC